MKRMHRMQVASLAVASAISLAFPVAGTPAEGDGINSLFLLDQMEYRWNQGRNSVDWNGFGWIGGDYNRLWVKSQGESVINGPVEQAEVQALYGRLVAPFWDVQVGLRYDEKPKPSRAYAVFGVQGLAQYWFDVEAAAFVSDKGDVSARVEAEYDVLFTQRLILQPRIELNLAAQKVEELRLGSGFNNVELGLRLRYEIRREFAPYVGISWTRQLGETANLVRQAGQDAGAFAVVAGVRVWF